MASTKRKTAGGKKVASKTPRKAPVAKGKTAVKPRKARKARKPKGKNDDGLLREERRVLMPKGNRNGRRYKAGTRALKEIRWYQQRVALQLPRLPFTRVCREVMADCTPVGLGYRIQKGALLALQEAAEAVIVQEFELAHLAAIHAKRVTVQPKDMLLVQSMRKIMMGFRKIGGT